MEFFFLGYQCVQYSFLNLKIVLIGFFSHQQIAQWAGAVEYTDCISVDGYDSPNEYPGYVTKQFDGTIYQPLRSGRIWHKVNF